MQAHDTCFVAVRCDATAPKTRRQQRDDDGDNNEATNGDDLLVLRGAWLLHERHRHDAWRQLDACPSCSSKTRRGTRQRRRQTTEAKRRQSHVPQDGGEEIGGAGGGGGEMIKPAGRRSEEFV